jgi:hypothetical protein
VTSDDLFANAADLPALAEDANGALYAAWVQHRGGALDAKLAVSRDGGRTWSAPVALNRDMAIAEHAFISLAPHANGVAAVWLDGRNKPDERHGDSMLRLADVDAHGALTNERTLDGRVCDCCATAAVQARQGLLVAYRDRSASEVRDISVVRETKGTWSEPRDVAKDGWTIKGCPVNGPQLDARGDLVAAAWFTAANDEPHVKLAFSRDGGATFGAPIVLDDGSPTGRVDVAFISKDTVAVVWLEGGEVRLRTASPSGPRTPSQRLGPAMKTTPRLAVAGTRMFVAWAEKGLRLWIGATR